MIFHDLNSFIKISCLQRLVYHLHLYILSDHDLIVLITFKIADNRCGHCGFNMGDNGDEFVRHVLQFCPRFSCSWDSDFKVLKDPEETKHKEYRVLWQCFEISKLKGESVWKEQKWNLLGREPI